MKLAPFLSDQWLKQTFFADPAIEFDLGSSTGPVWRLRELLDLGGDLEGQLDTGLFYTSPAGSEGTAGGTCRMENVQPEPVLVTSGND